MQAATSGRADQRATHHPWCSSKFYSAFSQESNEEADLSNVINRQAATSRKTHQRSDNCVRLIIRHACSFLCMMNAKFVLNPIHKFNFCTNPNVIFVDEKQGSDIPMLHLACLFWPHALGSKFGTFPHFYYFAHAFKWGRVVKLYQPRSKPDICGSCGEQNSFCCHNIKPETKSNGPCGEQDYFLLSQ